MPETVIPESFWTDDQQARERIVDSFVMKDDQVVYVDSIEDGRVSFRKVEEFHLFEQAPLADPSWNKYRTLPPLGWLNILVNTGRTRFAGAVHLRRVAIRSRVHGYNGNNIIINQFVEDTLTKSGLTLKSVYACGLYRNPEQYPNAEQAFASLRDGSAVALSNKFALFKDTKGLVWLYRKRRPVMLIPDVRTGLLLRSEKFYREDLEDNKDILPFEIKEL